MFAKRCYLDAGATGWLLALATLTAGAAAAQDAYVSNTEQDGTAGNTLSVNAHQAQKFTTGSESGGYALGSIGLTFNQDESGTGNLTVTINSEDSDGNPGTVVYTLTKPSSLTGLTEELFFAPSNAMLSADTSYFVTVEASGTYNSTLRITTSNAEDSGGSTGWSINDKRHFRSGSTDDWGESSNANKLKISVYPPQTLPWDTTMTVGSSGNRLGYSALGSSYGSLEDNTLVHDATEYEVRILDVNASEVRLRLGPNPGTSSGWVLKWAGEELPLDSATNTSTFGSNRVYQWDATWLTNNASSLDSSNYQTTVTSGSELTVCLRLSTQACSGESETSTDATLSDLVLQDTSDDSDIALSPTFATATTSYTVMVENDVAQILVNPTTNDDGATVEFLDADDMAIDDAESMEDGHQVALKAGANTIKVKVTAEDTMATETYTVVVTRAVSTACINSDATWCATMTVGYNSTVTTLSTVEQFGYSSDSSFGALDADDFAYAGTDYTVTRIIQGKLTTSGVVSSDDITVLTDASLPDGTVFTVNGTALTVGTGSHDSNVGQEVWNLKDLGITLGLVEDQLVTVTLDLPSTDATLSGLLLSNAADAANITISPTFASDVTSYTASVANDISQILVLPATNDGNASVAYFDADDNAITDAHADAGHQIDLAEGANTIKVKVTAEDTTITQTYEIVVTRAASTPDDTLVSNTGQTSSTTSRAINAQAFTTGSASLGYTLTSVGVALGTVGALYEGDGTLVRIFSVDSSGEPDSLEYTLSNPGTFTENAVNIFTAPANATLNADTAYAIVVTDADGDSLSEYSLERTMNTAEDTGAAAGWSIADTRYWSTTTFGTWTNSSNLLKISIQGDVTTSTSSTDATLSDLVLQDTSDNSVITLDPVFATGTTSYTASVDNDVSQIQVDPTVNDDTATVEFLDSGDNAIDDAESGEDGHQVDLTVGDNTIKVKVTAEDTMSTQTYEIVVTRAAANNPATGRPRVIDGEPYVGSTLTANTGNIADADGVTKAINGDADYAPSYQWTREDDDGGNKADITNATGTTYTLTTDDDGKRIRVTVSFRDDLDNDESLTSRALPRYGSIAPAVTPTTLSADTLLLVSNPRTGSTSIIAGGDDGDRMVQRFSVRAGTDYTLEEVRVCVVGNNLGVHAAIHTPNGNNPRNSRLYPLVRTSTATTGQVTFAPPANATLSGGTDYFVVVDGPNAQRSLCTTTSDAEDDVSLSGWSILDESRGRVVGGMWSNHNRSLAIQLRGVSNASGNATGAPTITGTATVDETLTAAKGTTADAEGLTKADNGDAGFTYSYQWIRVDGGTDTEITGATDSTHVLVDADEGKTIKVRASFYDDAGTRESVTSDATATIQPRASTDATLSDLDLSWDDSGTETDIALTPTFATATLSYTAMVANGVDEILVDPTTNDDGASVEFLDVDDMAIADANAADGHQVALAEGANTIKVKVTAEDGTIQTYTVVVTRAEAATTATVLVSNFGESGDATLQGLGSFKYAQRFSTGTAGSTLEDVSIDIDTGTTDNFSVAIHEPDSVTPANPASSALYPLSAPAVSGSGRQVYTAPDNAELDGSTNYFVVVSSSGNHALQGTSTGNETGKAGWSIANTSRLMAGTSWTSQGTEMHIRLRGEVETSTDATLSDLDLSWDDSGTETDITLTPAFATATTSYTAMVDNDVDQILVDPNVNDSNATVEFLNADDMDIDDAESMEDGHQIDLAVGDNTIKVKVTAEDTTSEETYEIVVTRAAANNAATGQPRVIDGEPYVGKTLTADKGDIADDDGVTKADNGDDGYAYSYQWAREDAGGGNEADITGATGSTYTLATDDEGKRVRVRVSFRDDLDNDESITSRSFPRYASVAPAVTPTTVSDDALVLVSNPRTGGFAYSLGSSSGNRPTQRFSVRAGTDYTLEEVTVCVAGNNRGVHAAIHTPSGNNPGDRLYPLVRTSTATTGPVTFAPPANATLSGGADYFVVVDGPHPERRGCTTNSNAEDDVSLSGWSIANGLRARAAGFVWQDHDRSLVIQLRGVSNASGNATGAPTITGTTAVDETLTAAKGTIADAEGLTKADNGDTGFIYSYQWIRVDGVTETDITGATDSTYVLVDADEGKTIKVRASFHDDAGTRESVTSDATATIQPRASTDATLSDLELQDTSDDSVITLTPTFASGTTSYTAMVANGVDEILVDPTTTDDGATVAYFDADDTAIADANAAAGHQIDLAEGDNTIKVKVTAEDTMSTQTYEIVVTRALEVSVLVSNTGRSHNDTSDIAGTSGGVTSRLAQGFTTGDNLGGYTLDRVRIAMDAITGSENALVSIYSNSGDSPDSLLHTLVSPASYPPLDEFYVFEAPADANLEASTTYHIVIEASSGNFLAGFTAADGEDPAGEDDWSLADDRRRSDDGAAWASYAEALRVRVFGSKRTPSDDATLSDLVLQDTSDDSDIALTPTFATATKSYTAMVANGVDEILVAPTTTDDGATVEFFDNNDTAIDDANTMDDGHQIALAEGDNTIKVKVTAEDTMTVVTYTVVVTRAASTDKNLVSNFGQTNLSAETNMLAQAFGTGSDSAGYTVTGVSIELGAGSLADIRLRIFPHDSNGEPDDSATADIIELTDPSTLVQNAVNTFSAPNDTKLDANTTYVLVISNDAGTGSPDTEVQVTAGNSQTSDFGWTVRDSLNRRATDSDSWLPSTDVVKLSVGGDISPVTTNAMGAPAISGAPQVDETLTAEMGDIADTDGLPSGSFPTGYTFQWIHVDGSDGSENDIPGATDQTYTPVGADMGHKLKVEVTFTDGASNVETLTSDAYPSQGFPESAIGIVAAKSACPSDAEWCAEMTVGFHSSLPTAESYGWDLDNSVGDIDVHEFDQAGSANQLLAAFMRDGVIAGSSDAIVLAALNDVPPGSVFDFGGTEFTIDATSRYEEGGYDWSIPSGFGLVVGQKVTLSLDLVPILTGATVHGDTLVLTYHEDLEITSTLPAASDFMVTVDSGTPAAPSDVAISGTEVTLTLATAVTSGQTVTVSYTPGVNAIQDESGLEADDLTDEPVTNNTTAVDTTSVLVSNHLQTAHSTSLAVGNHDKRYTQGFATGSNAGGYNLDSVGIFVTTAHLETGETFTVHIYTADNNGAIDTLVHTLTSPASYTDGNVNLFDAPANATLDADTDYLIVYQATGDQGSDFILSQTASDSEDSGSATGWSIEDAARFDDSLLSDGRSFQISVSGSEIASTAATGAPDITGAPQVGMTLTAGKGDIADTDGLPSGTFPTGYSFQWMRVDSDGTNPVNVGTDSNTYVPVTADIAKNIKVEVTFTDGGSTEETVVSDSTFAVMPAADTSTCDTETIWCATLTSGRPANEEVGESAGFDSETMPVYGSISPNTFVHGGTTYTVTSLAAGGTHDIYFTTSPDLPTGGAGLTLHIQTVGGERALPLRDADSFSAANGWFFDTGSWTPPEGNDDDVTLLRKFSRSMRLPAVTDIGTEVAVRLSGIPPLFTGAVVDGDTLVLSYDNTLDDTSTPVAGDFSVTVDSGTPAAPSNVSVSGSEVTLTLAAAVTAGQTVTVSYTSGTNPVQDESGLEAADLTDEAVTNDTPRLVTEIWSATLTVQGLGSGHRGCGNSSTGNECTDTANLSEDEFNYDSTDYDVTAVRVQSNGQLQIWFDPNLAAGDARSMALIVDGETFRFEDADAKNANNRRWNNSGLNWATNADIVLRLTEDPGSSDADLSGLVIEDYDFIDVPLAFSPAVSSDVTNYALERLANEVGVITVRPSTSDGDATVAYLDAFGQPIADDDTFTAEMDIALDEGASTIEIEVTAEDGVTVKSYFLSVMREPSSLPAGVLVSNFWQSGGRSTSSSQVSQSFTTGSNPTGYDLTGVAVEVNAFESMRGALVRVVPAASNGEPDLSDPSRIVTLSNPAMTSDGVLNVFTAPMGARLAANTTYHVVVTSADGTNSLGSVRLTNSDAEDAGSAGGWRIGDVSYTRLSDTAVWTQNTRVLSMQILAELNTDITECPPGNDWCAEMTVGVFAADAGQKFIGYAFSSLDPYGALDDRDFDFEGRTYNIRLLSIHDQVNLQDLIGIATDTDWPLGPRFDFGGAEFVLEAYRFSRKDSLSWPLPSGMTWVEGQMVTVSVNFAPEIHDAKVDNATLELTFHEALDENSVPAPGAFSVKIDGGDPVAPASVAVSGDTVTLTLSHPAYKDQTATLSYEPPAANPLQDAYGVKVIAFKNRAVTNNTLNTAAAGAPEISGAPQVGGTLRAERGSISDIDGLPSSFPGDYRFQWIRVDGSDAETVIAGATGRDYAPVNADVGNRLKVRVSFSDNGGAPESRTSEAHPSLGYPVGGLTVQPRPAACPDDSDWCAEMTVEARELPSVTTLGYLENGYGALDDTEFVLGGVTYEVEQIRIQVEQDSVRVELSRSPPAGTVFDIGGAQLEFPSANLSATSGLVPAGFVIVDGQQMTVSMKAGNLLARGKPVVVGAAVVGQTLTASAGGIFDWNGTERAVAGDTGFAFEYQWLRVDSGNETPIAGATSDTYTLDAADVGKSIKAQVSFTDDLGNAEGPIGSEATAVVMAAGDNAVPVFDGGNTQTRGLDENIGESEDSAPREIGAAVSATDADSGDTLTYSLGGADAAKFTIDPASGQLRTRAGERYDFERKPVYSLIVAVNDGTVELTANVTVRIVDLAEVPVTPSRILIRRVPGDPTALEVEWTLVGDDGRPEVQVYELRYRLAGQTSWPGALESRNRDARITGLTPGRLYELQVRAVNADGPSEWSEIARESTGQLPPPEISFGSASYTAIEGAAGATVEVVVFPPQNRALTIPLTVTEQDGATAADWSGVPANVTVEAGQASASFIVTAAADEDADDAESLLLGFGALPGNATVGDPAEARVALLSDTSVVTWYVFFEEAEYGVTEGDSVTVTVGLSNPWKPAENEALTIGLFAPEHQGGARKKDYSGVPESVTFQPGQTRVSFEITATDDSDDDDGESILLQFTRWYDDDLKTGRGPYPATVHLHDNDGLEEVRASFGEQSYTVREGGFVDIEVQLDQPPGRELTIPIEVQTENGAGPNDYTIETLEATFAATQTSSYIEIEAHDDNSNDDLEYLEIRFGELPDKVREGDPSTTIVNLEDADNGRINVTVRMAGGGEKHEGGGTFLYIYLNEEQEVDVVVPLVVEHLDGATEDDYSGVPATVRIPAGEIRDGVIIDVLEDSDNDDGEGIRVDFGDLPAGVREDRLHRAATYRFLDNDDVPQMTIQGDGAKEWPNPISYLKFVVTLDYIPEFEVTVDYATEDGTAVANQDYKPTSGTLTFSPGQRAKNLWVEVCSDGIDEDTERMTLRLSNPVRAEFRNGATASATGTISDYRGLGSKPCSTGIVIEDAEAREFPPSLQVAQDNEMTFNVRLNRKAKQPVTVSYRTMDGTATAGQDYDAVSGVLRFEPGETEKTITVTVKTDLHDDPGETFTMLLSNPQGAYLGDGEATGTIKNSGPMPGAWLSRFGRVAADQAVQSIGERVREGTRPRQNNQFTLGGRRVDTYFDSFMPRTGDDGAERRQGGASLLADDGFLADDSVQAGDGALTPDAGTADGSLAGGSPVAGRSLSAERSSRIAMPWDGLDAIPTDIDARPGMTSTSRTWQPPTLRELMMGASFDYSRALDENGEPRPSGWLGEWSSWGRTAATRFSGADGPLSINGEVATATLGLDSQWDRWIGGVALSYSEGEGAYTHRSATGGAVSSSLTSLMPYASYTLNDRTSVWGTLGYGVGDLTLTPEGASAGIETDLSTALAAFGGRGVLNARVAGIRLAWVSDALLTETSSDTVQGLNGAAGGTSRVRLMLEGSGSVALGGVVLRPRVEAGLRYDGGDAETGAGIELGGGLGYAAGRIAVQINARGLVAHEDAAYEEWGFSGSVQYRPGKDGRGLTMQLGSAWGATQSGVQSLWARADASGLARTAGFQAAQRFQAELGYGLAGPKGRALWVPFLQGQSSGGAQALVLGVRMTSGANISAGLEIGGRAGAGAEIEPAVQLNGSVRW